MPSKLQTLARHDAALGDQLGELLAHFFYPLHAHCPACGSPDCERWRFVRELAPVSPGVVEAIHGSGIRPR
jgi:hypothetical protein